MQKLFADAIAINVPPLQGEGKTFFSILQIY
jgi:hypothetical protein